MQDTYIYGNSLNKKNYNKINGKQTRGICRPLDHKMAIPFCNSITIKLITTLKTS